MAFERFKSKPDLPRYENSTSPFHPAKPESSYESGSINSHFHPRPRGIIQNIRTGFGLIPKYSSLPSRQKRQVERWVLLILGLLAIWKLFFMRSTDLYHSSDKTTFRSFRSSDSTSNKKAIANFDDNYVGVTEHYDLRYVGGSNDGWKKEEYLLLCIPLRNAVPVLPMMISHLENLTYPHHLIDLAFLVSDSDDSTEFDLGLLLQQSETITKTFHDIEIFHKDFGAIVGQGFDDRHGVKVQGVRRKLMGRARNWLTTAALKPYHTWVYWRDADIEVAPPTIIEDLMKHGRDVIVPNVWRPLPEWLGNEQPYDLNSWQESDPALELAKTLDEDDVIVEGYAEYPTWRVHLAYFRNEDGDLDEMFDLDGIGGVSILARAKVFRQGAMFPGFALWNHAETEGFGKMCRKMGFTVSGLPHYTVWHIYEPSEDDLKKMKEMAEGGGDMTKEEIEKLKVVSQVEEAKTAVEPVNTVGVSQSEPEVVTENIVRPVVDDHPVESQTLVKSQPPVKKEQAPVRVLE